MSEVQRFDVTVARRVKFVPRSAPFYRRLESFVGALPSHRDTRSGRRNATQIRVVLLATGILTVVFWQSPWAPLALLLCLIALVLPMPISRRRALVASLRARRAKQTRIERSRGVLEVSQKHLTLLDGDERIRRLRRSAVSVEQEGTTLWMREGQKKKNALAVSESQTTLDVDAWAEDVSVDRVLAAVR